MNKAKAHTTEQTAVDIGKLLSEHKGGDVLVMDMRKINFWTDFFVIGTVSSSTHLYGLERHIRDFTRERGIETLRRSPKPREGEEWSLIDLGAIVVHLMTSKARSFYELERLWAAASIIYQDADKPPV
ncbi:MAG: ribosome silencing factor [Treponema sp.]|nr:ribosome silencing factor [Treponema sp.]